MGGSDFTCTRCGKEIHDGSSSGLCPRCLIQRFSSGDGGIDEAVTEAAPPPSSFLDASASPRIHRALASLENQLIGNYKVLQKIGEGGFGIVYMADQLRPVKRRVALKIIKIGMDTAEVVARFEAERQALALMEHPSIAKVFDAGSTETGRPYFVMELVRGIPITDYCNEQRLATRDRLELFRQVCQAVQHAHQKGIIHRDLKPSNVMITIDADKPIPKVIDFGIAKATQQPLTDHTLVTLYDQFAGTPIYMSPEQARMGGLDIDTRSDIYSLGVMLYELLTGQTPFQRGALMGGGVDEFRRKLSEEEPPKPSTRLSTLDAATLSEIARHHRADPRQLKSLLRGDLDWIVMKAIEKDRTRRYDSASGLEQDIRRHLDNQPVSAAAPSLGYTLAKFAARNRKTLVAGVAIGLVLVLATIVSSLMAIAANHAKDAADRAKANETKALQETQLAKGLADRNLILSRQAEGRTWLRGARLMLEQKRFLSARVMAGKALGFQGFGRPQADATFDELFPILLDPASPEWARAKQIVSGEFDYPLRWSRRDEDDPGGFGHSEMVKRVAFHPGGGQLVTAGFDHSVRLWDCVSGEQTSVLDGHQQNVWEVAFSPDGKFLASADERGEVIVWDLANGTKHRVENPGQAIFAMAFHPGGKMLATAGSSAEIMLLDLGGLEGTAAIKPLGAPLRPGDGYIRDIAFDPSGERLASVGLDRHLRLWDLETRREIRARPHQEVLSAVAFHPDGQQVVTAGDAGELRFWSTRDLSQIETLPGHPTGVNGLSFSPDGSVLASAGKDSQVKLWQVATSRLIATLEGHRGEVEDVAFGPDGAVLASCGKDHTVRLWQFERSLATPVRHSQEIAAVEYTLHGRQLAASVDTNRVGLFDAHTGELQAEFCHHSEVLSFAISPDASLLAVGCADHQIYLWDPAAPGSPIRSLSGHTRPVTCLDLSTDGRTLASGGLEKHVLVWDLRAASEPLRLPHPNTILSLALSPAADLLAVGVNDGSVHVWKNFAGGEPELATGPLRAYGESQQEVDSLSFDATGSRLASASRSDRDNAVKIWSVADWSQTHNLTHSQRVRCLAFALQGDRLAVGDENMQVRLWDLGAGETVTIFNGHAGAILGLSIDTANNRLASCSADGTARTWSLDPQDWNSSAHLLAANELFTAKEAEFGYLWSIYDSSKLPPQGFRALTKPDFWRFYQARNWRSALLALGQAAGGSTEAQRQLLAMALVVEAQNFLEGGDRSLAAKRLAEASLAAADSPFTYRGRSSLLAEDGAPATTIPILQDGLAAATKLASNASSDRARFSLAWLLYQRHVDAGQLDTARQVIDGILSDGRGIPAGMTTRDLLAPLIDHQIALAEGADDTTRERLLRTVAAVEIGELIGTPPPHRLRPNRTLQALEALHDERVAGRFPGLATMQTRWKFFAGDYAPRAGWKAIDFDDSRWGEGPARLGFGDTGMATLIDRNASNDPKMPSRTAFYFRAGFEFQPLEPAALEQMRIVLSIERDDGVIVYLNGEEIVRDNMPAGPVDYGTLAAESGIEDVHFEFEVPANLLRPGKNLFAAEVHQENAGSSDVHFELTAALKAVTAGSYFATLAQREPGAVGQTLDDLREFLPPSLAQSWCERIALGFREGMPEDSAGRGESQAGSGQR